MSVVVEGVKGGLANLELVALDKKKTDFLRREILARMVEIQYADRGFS